MLTDWPCSVMLVAMKEMAFHLNQPLVPTIDLAADTWLAEYYDSPNRNIYLQQLKKTQPSLYHEIMARLV